MTFFKDRRLIQTKLSDDGSTVERVLEFFNGQFGRLRDVAISPDGTVYICTDNGNNQDMIIEETKTQPLKTSKHHFSLKGWHGVA